MIGGQKAARLARILDIVSAELKGPGGAKLDQDGIAGAFESACFQANTEAPQVTELDGQRAVTYPSYDLKFLRYPVADAQQSMVFEEATGSKRMDAVYKAAGLPTSEEATQ